MTYAGKIVSFIGVTVGKSAFKRTEIAEICTVIGISSDKATRKVVDIAGKLVFEDIGKYRKITVIIIPITCYYTTIIRLFGDSIKRIIGIIYKISVSVGHLGQFSIGIVGIGSKGIEIGSVY